MYENMNKKLNEIQMCR